MADGWNTWTCTNCGCVHWDDLKPISCIMCNHDEFVENPDQYYETKKEKDAKKNDM